ncbi:MAG TPA: hypothetical protein VMW56_22550 [Candidatus Margulisiibacteriota bacterium]|nr:hypothetical protein [Candidatus Margulisiibacteriota bacterium]
MAWRRIIIVLAIAAPLFVYGAIRAAGAAEMSVQDVNCRKALALGVRKLGAKVRSEMETCQQARMRGEVWDAAHNTWVVPDSSYFQGPPSMVDCRDLTRLPAPSMKKIDRAASTLNILARGRCREGVSPPAALGYAPCPPPCGGIAISDYSSVATCLACRVESDSLAMNSDIVNCHSSLDYALRKYMSLRFEEQARCQYRADSGKNSSTDCMTADSNGHIAAARAALLALIDECVVQCGNELGDGMFTCVFN